MLTFSRSGSLQKIFIFASLGKSFGKSLCKGMINFHVHIFGMYRTVSDTAEAGDTDLRIYMEILSDCIYRAVIAADTAAHTAFRC